MEPTEIQKTIITSKGNLVIMASPGSGKTYVISEKIKTLLRNDEIKDYQGVIAISYTRKASANLKDRTLDGGLSCKNSFFGTIDSFCLTQIILCFGDYVLGFPEKVINSIKIGELPEEQRKEYNWLAENKPDYENIKDGNWIQLFDLYKKGFVLVESLELIALYIFRNSIACRNCIKARFKYIFIDEFQDADTYTDALFRDLVTLGLTGIVVGDKNQSIFGFAHKDNRYLLQLSQDDNFASYILDRNFRCAPSIINYSNRLLDGNCKLLKSDEVNISYLLIEGGEEKVAEFLSGFISSKRKEKGFENLKEVAILVKNIKSLDLIDKALSIPHHRVETTVLDQEMNPCARLYAELLLFYFDPNMMMMSIVDEFTDYDMLSIQEKKELARLTMCIRSIDKDHLAYLLELFRSIANILMPNQHEGLSAKKLREVLADEKMLMTYSPVTKDEVVLMTLHKSKGLEFDYVFHLNMNEWEIPAKIPLDGDFNNTKYINYEQDLDLHYVGITRARKGCVLIGNTLRTTSTGKTSIAKASEFLSINNLANLRKNLVYSDGQIRNM